MLRKGFILVGVLLAVSLTVTQAQEPRNSTDTVFYDPYQGTPEQTAQERVTQQHIQEWEQLLENGRHGNPIHSVAAPRKAKAAFRKAMKEIGKGSAADLEKARQFLEKAGALDERYLAPYDALVWLYMAKGDWDHATELAKFVLDINPTDAKMLWYLAVCAYQTGRDDEALALFREIQGDIEAAKFPHTHLFTGLIYARRGQLAKAAADYRLYLLFVPEAPDAEAVKKQLNEWQQLGAN